MISILSLCSSFSRKCRLEGELTQQSGRTAELNYSFMDEHGGLNEGVVTPADMLSFARQVAMAMVNIHWYIFLECLLK